jgi:hypothetical protein
MPEKGLRWVCEPIQREKNLGYGDSDGQMTAASFPPELPWYFGYGLRHYGHLADRTAPARPVPTKLGRTVDGRVGRSSLASRRTRKSSRARNCFLVGLELAGPLTPSLTSSETWTPDLGSKPNSHVSPYDAAFPGTLPVSNQQVFVQQKVMTAILSV